MKISFKQLTEIINKFILEKNNILLSAKPSKNNKSSEEEFTPPENETEETQKEISTAGAVAGVTVPLGASPTFPGSELKKTKKKKKK
jgi:hypothetical protein